MDLAAPKGTDIEALYSGRVKHAGAGLNGVNSGLGNFVIMEHYWGTATYGHLDSVNVNKGDTVFAGEKIGEVGSTGKSTGPHLHFEMKGKNKQNMLLNDKLAEEMGGYIFTSPNYINLSFS